MLYPRFLEKNDIIGITAPSQGVGDHLESFKKSIKTLEEYGYKIKETASVRNKGMVSTTGEKRSQELDEVITDKNVKMIICASGGDFLLDMLPTINWKNIKQNPKWIMGYSDPTALLYITTTKLDIATIYGCNAGSFDQTNLHECLKNNLKILSGNILTQKSFDLYQKNNNLLKKYTPDDLRIVIDKKCAEWLNNPKMCVFLKPHVLFGDKFERYLHEDVVLPKRTLKDISYAELDVAIEAEKRKNESS